MGTSTELLDLLNSAINREIYVSVLYMLQHSTWSVPEKGTSGKQTELEQKKFIGSHSAVWLPGSSLKKIAITEMRHAEAITERVVELGGKATLELKPVVLGNSPKEVLVIDKDQETEAIRLYRQIINLADRENDNITKELFANWPAPKKVTTYKVSVASILASGAGGLYPKEL